MAIAIDISPDYPLPENRVTVRFTGATTNYVRLWATEAPPGSAYRAKLDTAAATRVQVHEADVRQPWVFIPDAGGVYSFKAQEYARNQGYGGSYAGDPDGFTTETPTGSEVSLSIEVGQKMTFPIGTNEHESTLVMHVWGAYIRAASVAIHGEVSPRIDPADTPLAINSARASGVTSKLAALAPTVAITAATAIGDLVDVFDDFIQQSDTHLTNPGTHNVDDNENSVPQAYKTPSTQAALIESIGKAIEVFAAHMANDDRGGDGPGSTLYHGGGARRADRNNTLLAGPPSDMPSALIALADLCRAYTAHEVDATNFHASASVVPLPTRPPLLAVMEAFQVELADITPATAPGQQTGVALLAGIGGSTA